jgi:hypothetical protein
VTSGPQVGPRSYGALAIALCCVRVEEDERGEGMNNTVSLVIAVLVIILLIYLILEFV